MNRVRHRAPGRFAALRERYRWLDRVVRAGSRYLDHKGYAFAASITYFTVLSLIPLLLVALSVTSFVLAGQPAVLDQLHAQIDLAVPPSLASTLDNLVNGLIDHRTRIGVIGLAVALYSGWNWMNTLRDALTAMWDLQPARQPVVRMVLKDVLALLGLAGALLVTFACTAVAGWLGTLLLRLAGLSDTGWVHGVLVVAALVLAVAANWLVFIWVLAKLPREPVEARSAVRGALAAAVAFEVLKWLGNIYLTAVGRTPLGVTFGWLVGLLLFIYLVARMLMLVTAWTAVGATPKPADHAVPKQRDGYPADVSRAETPEPAGR
ncbi:MAG TPA: YihY/virulence factor BrkB family protein [Pseudonocardiaceae bacterium]|jgi:membrane protein|nr:YihY/virulence factor BrkB family protein [Pseudonocardiaceae bacterium]